MPNWIACFGSGEPSSKILRLPMIMSYPHHRHTACRQSLCFF
jgi:hypothetical protein